MIRSFHQLEEALRGLPPMVPVLAAAWEEEALGSLCRARRSGLVARPLLTGPRTRIEALLRKLGEPLGEYEILVAEDEETSAREAVRAVRAGDAEILVKGALKTATYLRAILDKRQGLRAAPLLSNMSLFEMPSYHKLLGLTDNAIVLLPDLQQKQSIIENTRPLWRALGITQPKVAVLAAIESVHPAMPATVDAARLTERAAAGDLEGFIVEGPLGYDAALDRACAVRKHLETSRVAGDPDLLLAPSLEAANMLGKSYKLHGGARWGGLIFGASVPVVLNSRSDDAGNRLRSLLLARAVAEKRPLEAVDP